MANEVFVDTNGFFAAINPHDVHHADADRWIRGRGKAYRLVTTDYVLDESATLLKARNQPHLAAPWLERTVTMKNLEIEWMNSIRFKEVRQFFAKHADKDWSFTDCFSFWVMRERGIHKAFTNDHHFRQAGFEPLLGPAQ